MMWRKSRDLLLKKKILIDEQSPYQGDSDIKIATAVIYLSILVIGGYAFIAA